METLILTFFVVFILFFVFGVFRFLLLNFKKDDLIFEKKSFIDELIEIGVSGIIKEYKEKKDRNEFIKDVVLKFKNKWPSAVVDYNTNHVKIGDFNLEQDLCSLGAITIYEEMNDDFPSSVVDKEFASIYVEDERILLFPADLF